MDTNAVYGTNGEVAVSEGSGIILIIYLALIVLSIVALWKVFTKAGKPGWASIIPIYNTVVLIQIAGKPVWWIILYFIPVVNIVISILVIVGIAQKFGRGVGTILGLIFFPIIFLLILGFGSAQYQDDQPVKLEL